MNGVGGLLSGMALPSVAQVAERHGLNDQQRLFIAAVIQRGKTPEDAAESAGYSSPASVHYLLGNRRVREALHEAVALMLQADAPVNLHVLRGIRDDTKAAAGVRADIAMKLLRLAGHIERPAGADDAPLKQLSEMSADELRAWRERNEQEIDRLEAELAARSIDVSAPASAPEAPIAGAKPKQYLD